MKITGPAASLTSSIKLSPELTKALEGRDAKAAGKADFSSMLTNKINETDQLQKAADVAVTDFATGKSRNIHETVLAMEMADTSLRLMVTVRNKALEAYQEIMRMPV